MAEPIRMYLNKGAWTLVDAEDWDALKGFRWRTAKRSGVTYACRTLRRAECGGKSGASVLLHRVILQPPAGFVVDHINGDGLDNRRANLRVATISQNLQNQRQRAPRVGPQASRFKGVRFNQNRWEARIGVSGKMLFIGCFDTEEQAALAYDAEAKLHFGEFAKCNNP